MKSSSYPTSHNHQWLTCVNHTPISLVHHRTHKQKALSANSHPLTVRDPLASHTALKNQEEMAAMNSGVLACNYVLSGASESSRKLVSMPSSVSPVVAHPRVQSVRAQQVQSSEPQERSEGRRAALLGLAGVLFTTAATVSSANAGIIDEYLEKSKANKELNDKKRLATSGANFARAFTVEFGTCKFPYNFTGCQDLAKQKKVPFISDDLEIECEGKEKYKCGSNVFWKW